MTRPPPRLTPFPYPTLFRSTCSSSPRPRCGAFLRLALACVNAVAAQDVADDDRDAAERGERRRAAADANLHAAVERSEEHTSELQSRQYLVCRLLLEKKRE